MAIQPSSGWLHRVTREPAPTPGSPPLVFLHGLSQSHATFEQLAARLASTRSVQLVDLPGHGRSCRLDDYSVGNMVEWVAASLRDQNGPVDVYGHSLGALVAAGFAARHPAQVRRLALADPPLVFWDESRWQRSVISGYFHWLRNALRRDTSRADLLEGLRAAFPHRSAQILQQQAAALHQLDLKLIDTLFGGGLVSEAEVYRWLADIRCPVLLLQADPRILAAASDADILRVTAQLDDVEHIRFEKADHDLHLWKPARVADTLQDFLSREAGQKA